MGRRQYHRSLMLVYGDQDQSLATGPSIPFTLHTTGSDGLRMTFSATRSNRGDPDRCAVNVYNMPDGIREAIKSDLEDQLRKRREIQSSRVSNVERARRLKEVSDAYRINLFAGYGRQADDFQLVFRGDLVDVSPTIRRGGVDTITRIELGDTLFALRDSYMRQTFGSGATPENILRATAAAAQLQLDGAAETFISLVGPNAVVTKMQNGYAAVGRVGDTVDEIADLFGLQWWVRDGRLYLVPQGATLQDFSIELREGRDLLDFNEESSYHDTMGRALLNPDIVPGRGLILIDASGQRFDRLGYRVNRCTYRGDTDMGPWMVSFEASGVDASLFGPTVEFGFENFTPSDALELLETRAR